MPTEDLGNCTLQMTEGCLPHRQEPGAQAVHPSAIQNPQTAGKVGIVFTTEMALLGTRC